MIIYLSVFDWQGFCLKDYMKVFITVNCVNAKTQFSVLNNEEIL